MDLSLKQINKQHVKAIPIPNDDKRPIKGYDICEEVYANIFLCAKKKSGKTSALFHLVKNCAGRNTIIVVFCSTAYKDKNWIEIRKYFENKGMDIRVFTSIFEDGQDHFSSLLKSSNIMMYSGDKYLDFFGFFFFGSSTCLDRPVAAKCISVNRRNISSQLLCSGSGSSASSSFASCFKSSIRESSSPSLLSLLKANRHFKSKLIISSQWIHDLLPQSRKQIDLFMIFRGFTQAKLNEIYKDCDSGVPFDTFVNIYNKATERPHSFLYVDARSDCFRRNFNEQFIIRHNNEN